MQMLSELTGGGAFVDNGLVHCIGLNEFISNGPSFVIDSSTGLIGTPTVQNTFVILNSVTASGSTDGQNLYQINGPHRVSGVKHRGMISPAVCGEAITTLSLLPVLNGVPVQLGL
jgi:hypothetical protein